MFDYRAIHVALLLWACLFSLIAAVCMAINTNFEPTKRRWLLAMQLFGAVLMGCDALAWAYRGGAGEVGYWMVRVSSFLVFFASDLILLIFHGYVCCYLLEDTPKFESPRRRIAAGYAIAALGMALVVVSQFTLYGDTKKGYRPSFIKAAKPPLSVDAYELFLAEMNKHGLKDVQHGEFGADMQVTLVNEGPCTIIIDTDEWKKKE